MIMKTTETTLLGQHNQLQKQNLAEFQQHNRQLPVSRHKQQIGRLSQVCELGQVSPVGGCEIDSRDCGENFSPSNLQSE